jgi:hypothetical protein
MNTEAINPICNMPLIQYKLLRMEEPSIITPTTEYEWLNKHSIMCHIGNTKESTKQMCYIINNYSSNVW